MRHLVSSLPERGDYPFLACLLSLRKDKTFATSKWVGGGNLDGHVAFKASVLFPAAKKDLQVSMKVDLAAFDFPLSGSNFSGYREAPREVALTPFFLEGGKQRVLDWAQAKKEGCGDFCIRLVVVPISVSEVMVQVGAVPFTLDHLKQEYKEVYDEAFFPNTFLRVTKQKTQLPRDVAKVLGVQSTSLAKRVDLMMPDTKHFGFGAVPYISCLHFNPETEPIPMPDFSAVLEAVCDFYRAGSQPVAKSAAALPEALAVALLADKDDRNMVDPVVSPWPAFSTLEAGSRTGGGAGAARDPDAIGGMSHFRN